MCILTRVEYAKRILIDSFRYEEAFSGAFPRMGRKADDMAGEFEKLEERIKNLEYATRDKRGAEHDSQLAHADPGAVVAALKGVEPRIQRLEARVTQMVAQLEESKKSAAGMADIKNAILKIGELEKKLKALEAKVH